MPPEVKTFRDLIAWLVREHHKGVWLDMARKLGVSSGLIYQWRDGTVKAPSDDYIDRICATYKLDYWKVIAIIKGRKPPSAAIFIPFILGLGLLALTSGRAEAEPLPNQAFTPHFSHNPDLVRLLGTWLRRLWRALGQTNPMHNAWSAEASYCAS